MQIYSERPYKWSPLNLYKKVMEKKDKKPDITKMLKREKEDNNAHK